MNTETTKRGRPAASATTKDPKKFSIKREEKRATVREFVCKGKPTVLLGGGNIIIYDEDAGHNREIRYCAAEKSIFLDEQSPSAVKTPIVFTMGRLLVNEKQQNLYEFLSKHPSNEKNGGSLFKEVLPDRETVQVKIEEEFLVSDAINMLRDKPLDDLLAVAISFSIDIDRTVQEIKYDLLQTLKKNPKKFIDAFDNPVVQMKAKIKQATSLNIITMRPDSVVWTDSNKQIVSVPAGMDPTDVFVRYCLTEAASPVVAEMERQLQ